MRLSIKERSCALFCALSTSFPALSSTSSLVKFCDLGNSLGVLLEGAGGASAPDLLGGVKGMLLLSEERREGVFMYCGKACVRWERLCGERRFCGMERI